MDKKKRNYKKLSIMITIIFVMFIVFAVMLMVGINNQYEYLAFKYAEQTALLGGCYCPA